MPLPITPYFELRLTYLRSLNADVAALAMKIADAQIPEVLLESPQKQTEKLFDRLDELARQEAGCVLPLAAWLSGLVIFKALTDGELLEFLNRAIELGGPNVVVPE